MVEKEAIDGEDLTVALIDPKERLNQSDFRGSLIDE